QHPFEVRESVPFADAQADPRRVPARDDPSEETRCDFVPDEQLDESRIAHDARHLDLEAGDDLLGPEDVEPLRDVRPDPIAADEELAFQRLRFAVLIEHDLDASVLPAGRLRLGSEERVRALADRIRRDRAVEHRPLDDDRFRVVPIDHELSCRWRVELRPVHGADDRLLAMHVVEDAGRDEAAALNRFPDLPVFLDERDLVSRGRDLPREISSRRSRADHEEVLEVFRQGGVVGVSAGRQVRGRDQGRGPVDDHVRRDEPLPVDGGRALRDLLAGFRDDRESNAACDGLVDLLPHALSDFRERRGRDDARLRRLIDQVADLLKDPRLRDDCVDELRLALGPQDLVEQVELAERVLQMVDHAALDLARRFGLEDRRPAAGRNRESFLAEALEDLVRGRPRDVRRLRDRLRAAVTVRDERDVPAGLVSGEADGLEGLRGPFELLLQVHSLSEELRQVLRNHGARYPRTPLYLFETAGSAPLCGPNLPSGPMGSARPALLALIVVLMVFWSVVPSTQGQGPAGNLVVSTDYELFGTYDLRGGGHVTWTWTGLRATDFRLKLLHLFDEYTTIPRGFVYAGATTNANRDGRLDSLEGVAYTDLLERSLENAPRGTQSQYLQMFPFDLRDKTGDPATSFDRSTSGLAGANASTSSPVEIRFLFEANITTTNGRVPLATSALVSPVYQIFSYRAVQSPMLNSSGSYPGSWPFLPENGWHVVTVGGRAAFWAGNDTTGLYDNNLDASSRTSADPPLAADPAYVPFDLRFAL